VRPPSTGDRRTPSRSRGTAPSRVCRYPGLHIARHSRDRRTVRRSGLAFAIQASHRPLHPVAGDVVRVRDAGGPRRSPPAQGSRFCAGREPAGGERRLGACIRRLAAAEEIELGKDDRRGEAEETGSACIEHDFGLTRERIGRLSWHCARPRARTADEKRLYCSEFTKAEANAL